MSWRFSEHLKIPGNLFGLGIVSRVRFIPSSRAAAKVVEDVCDEWVTEQQSIEMLKVSNFTPKTQCEHTWTTYTCSSSKTLSFLSLGFKGAALPANCKPCRLVACTAPKVCFLVLVRLRHSLYPVSLSRGDLAANQTRIGPSQWCVPPNLQVI